MTGLGGMMAKELHGDAGTSTDACCPLLGETSGMREKGRKGNTRPHEDLHTRSVIGRFKPVLLPSLSLHGSRPKPFPPKSNASAERRNWRRDGSKEAGSRERRTPRRGGGGGGEIPSGDGGAGGGGLPCDDGGGGGGRGGPGDGKTNLAEPSGRPARVRDPYHLIGGTPGGAGGGRLHSRGKGLAAEDSGRPSRGGENEDGTGGTPRSYGGAVSGSGAGWSDLHGGGKDGAWTGIDLGGGNDACGPFSEFLVLCIDCTEENFAVYKHKIEALGGIAGTGFDYRAATHIALEGVIQPGGRAIWEGDGKVVTTTRWIDNCFKEGRLLPNPAKESSESLLPSLNATPLGSKKYIGRTCTSEGKLCKHRHGTSQPQPSSSRRKLKFSPSSMFQPQPSSSRRKLKLSPSSMFHNILSCEADQRRSESLYDYALSFRTYENNILPGIPGSFKLCKTSTKFVLGRCYKLLPSLHQEMKSLGGHFSSRDFRIYADDTVVLDIPKTQLVIYSDSDGDKDYRSFVKMVEKEVFLDQPVPIDLAEWLSIISQGVSACHPNVLSNFIYLMEPFQAFGAFVTMYLQFSSIQSTAGWTDIANALSYYDDWPHPRCHLMLKTFGYADLNGYLVDYEDDIRGLLRLIWNCSKHRGKREVKSFVHMVLADYPRLLSDLQRALYDGGYLSHLTMKSH